MHAEHQSPLISVCVPVFNGEKYIRECLSSVLAQTESNFELLILDNCSTDRSVEISRQYKDPRIRILQHAENIGSLRNFNSCIVNARGEFFIMLPVDDLLLRNGLQLLVGGFLDNPSVAVAFGTGIQIDQDGKEIGKSRLMTDPGILAPAQALRMIAENFNPIQHPMVRIAALRRMGMFQHRRGCFSDIYLWSKAFFLGWDAYAVDAPVTATRRYKGQGQTLFRQNTRANLRLLSQHYGRTLNSSFYRKNHFNLLFLRFVMGFIRCARKSVGEMRDSENALIKKLFLSHVGNLLRSIRSVNLPSVVAEFGLCCRLVRWLGLARTFDNYVSSFGAAFRAAIGRVG